MILELCSCPFLLRSEVQNFHPPSRVTGALGLRTCGTASPIEQTKNLGGIPHCVRNDDAVVSSAHGKGKLRGSRLEEPHSQEWLGTPANAPGPAAKDTLRRPGLQGMVRNDDAEQRRAGLRTCGTCCAADAGLKPGATKTKADSSAAGAASE
jgi:hypothetical protein